jgi:streptogramin lyase
VVLATAAIIAAAGIGVLLVLGGGSSAKKVRVSAPSLVQIDAGTGHVIGDAPIAEPEGTVPTFVPPHQVWVLSHLYQVISIIDARTDTRIGTIGGFGGLQLAQQAGFAVLDSAGSVWVAGRNDTVSRIDPSSRQIQATVRLPEGPTLMAAGFGRIWVLGQDTNSVYVIDPATNRARRVGTTGNGTDGIAVGEGAVWVVNYADDTVSKIDPHTGTAKIIPVGNGPIGIGIGYGSVWVSNKAGPLPGGIPAQTVSQIDPATDRVVHTIRVGKATPSYASDIAPANGSMWVTCPSSHTVARIDPTTAKVIDTVSVPYLPTDLTTAQGQVWVTVQRTTQ